MSKAHVRGSVYQRDSGRWIAVTSPIIDTTNGKRRRISLGTYDDREAALEALSQFNSDRRPYEVGRQHIGEYLTRWLELVASQVEIGHLARRTASGYEQAVRLHIKPGLGHLRINELHHLVVHRWLTSLRTEKRLSDRSVLRIYRVAHRAMEDAPIGRNPMHLPKHLRPTVKSRRQIIRPNADAIGAFLAHLSECEGPGFRHPLFRLAAVSGMRCGELVGTTWPDFDFEAGNVFVSRALAVDKGQVFSKTPKSDTGKRLIGLDPETVRVLKAHRRRQAEDRLRIGSEYEDSPLGLNLVFRAGNSGGLIRPDVASRAFTKEWAHAGLRDGVTLHSLRHSMASLLVAEGFPLTEAAGRMGHSIEVLQRTYARDLDPKNREKRIVEAITGRF